MIRVSLDRPKTPHPPVGTPRGGDVIEHPPALNPPSPKPVTVTPESVTVTPPTVTVTAAALRQRKSRAARKYQRIAVPCHPDHLGGLDVWGL